MRLHQSAEKLRSDLVYARRAAMLLSRSPGDTWVRGVGIDLGEMDDGDNALNYSVFRWCSDDEEYEDYEDVVVEFSTNISPGSYTANYIADCTGQGFVKLKGKNEVVVSTSGLEYTDEINAGGEIRYILFESIRGIPHFFVLTGADVSLASPTSLVELAFDAGSNRKVVVAIDNFSEIYTYAP